MDKVYRQTERIWVLDRGMVSRGNIEFLRGRKAHYIVGKPNSQLRQFEAPLPEQKDWKLLRPEARRAVVSCFFPIR